MLFIPTRDERPALVNARTRSGEREPGTMMGKAHKQAIVTITEQKSKLTLIRKVTRKTARRVAQAIIYHKTHCLSCPHANLE